MACLLGKKKVALFCAVSLAIGVASAAITSRSYVPTGLVAQYDGIDNAGFGTHNPSAATWVNLTGDTALDGTVDSHVTWGADGWSVTENCKPITLGNGISAVTATGEFTIQFACTPYKGQNGSGGRQCFFSQYKSGVNGIGIEHNGVVNKNELRLYSSPVDGSAYSTSDPLATNVWVQGSVTASDGLTDIGFWKNGSKMNSTSTKTFTKKTYTSSCTSIIGGEPNTGRDMAFRGIYNAFRIYDRVLTEEELKINAAVDAIRFNGADWSNYPELSAYSFAADGTLQYSIGVEATVGGAVRLDDGAAAATVRAPFDYDGTAHSATFTAVPDSGYVFYRWEGDTAAITGGSYLSPTITVTAEKPFSSLTAVFRASTRGVTSRSYVQNGLVAQYDGIKNVGHDSDHSDNTSTWVDLTDNGNDATKNTNVTWAANGWKNSADCSPMTIPAGDGSATTIAGTTATKVFTAQFAVTPSRHNARQSFFGQYDKKGVSIEHNSGDTDKTGYLRGHYNFISGSAGDDKFKNSDVLVLSGELTSVSFLSDTSKQTVWKNGTTSQTITRSLSGALTNLCASYIGGDTRSSQGYRGMYHAFRLYNRVLKDDEVKFNAAVDAIRFNNGANMPTGYSAAADGTLLVAATATATTGGKVALKRVGMFSTTVSSNVNQDGSEITGFVAQPEEGYVFQRWIGDVDAIVHGTVLLPEIGVVATRPITLTAVFRKPNDNALDGLIFDFDIRDVVDGTRMGGTDSGYHVGNALKAGSSEGNTYYKTWYTQAQECRPMYRILDIPTPITPFTTNVAQSCIYTTHSDGEGGTNYVGRWELGNNLAEAPVATIYVRFLWEGPILPQQANYGCILCNGYVSWNNIGEGFVLRVESQANENKGFLNVFVPNIVPSVDRGTDLYITSNSWVDCFVSVYPSPTNFDLSNVDIWFCETPALGDNGIFGYPRLKHRHIGDEAGLPKFKSVPQARSMRLGAETSGATKSTTDICKAFRGYYGGIKVWERLLTENEMWSVMAGQYGGTFNVGVENGSADEFGGTWYETADPFDVATDKWQRMKKSLTAEDRTLTLVVPIPTESDGLPRVLEIVPLFDSVGASCLVTVTVNGASAGTFDLTKKDKRAIVLDGSLVKRDANGKITIAITRPEGCVGTLSFDALSMGGSWQIGAIDGSSEDMTMQAEGVPSVVIAGDPNYKHAQRGLTTTYNTLTIPFDAPRSSEGQCAYRYEAFIVSVKSGATHPVHIELNGETVWSNVNVAKGKVRVEIPAESVKPGLNELKWVYDTTTSSNWLSFDYHRMKMILPTGVVLIIR